MKNKYCYWTVADGHHGEMMKTAVASMRKAGIKEDIFVWTDVGNIEGARVSECGNFDKSHYMFKFEFLKHNLLKLDKKYSHFVFLDADSYVVRDPGNLLELMHKSPIHVSMESNCCDENNDRPDWWGCPLDKFSGLMRDRGVRAKKIYNCNAGFWIVHRDAIDTIYTLATDFWHYCKAQGYQFTEEAPLAYVAHMLSGNIELHTLDNTCDTWASDWTGQYKDVLPDGNHWVFTDYMNSKKKIMVNPAIVHCMRSKSVLHRLQGKLND